MGYFYGKSNPFFIQPNPIMKTYLFLLLLGFTVQLTAQDTLRIGVKHAPPFVMTDGDKVTGLSIQFWDLVNEDINAVYDFVPYEHVKGLLQAVSRSEVDLSINPITVSENRLEQVDFSQPYFISQTTFVKRKESRIMTFLSSLFSWEFFSAVAALLLLIFIFGLLLWVFERRTKNEQFHKSTRGIADGFWWSAVTMTTVGYGDKAPVSPGGRVVAFVWMFASIILISGLTAGIASALTVQSINSHVESLGDLSKMRTLTVANTSTNEFLNQYRIRHQTTASLKEALQQLLDGRTDVVVYDKPILMHEIREMGVGDELVVADRGFKTDYYSFTFPKDSPHLHDINKAVINKLKTRDWEQVKGEVE